MGFIADDLNFMESGTSGPNLLSDMPSHADFPGLTSSLGLATRQLFHRASRSGSVRGFGYSDLLNARNFFEPNLGMQLQGLYSGNAGSFTSPSQSSLPSTRDRTECFQTSGLDYRSWSVE